MLAREWFIGAVLASALVVGCQPDGDDASDGADDNLLAVNGLSMINGLSMTNGLANGNGLSMLNGLSSSTGLASGSGLMTTTSGRITAWVPRALCAARGTQRHQEGSERNVVHVRRPARPGAELGEQRLRHRLPGDRLRLHDGARQRRRRARSHLARFAGLQRSATAATRAIPTKRGRSSATSSSPARTARCRRTTARAAASPRGSCPAAWAPPPAPPGSSPTRSARARSARRTVPRRRGRARGRGTRRATATRGRSPSGAPRATARSSTPVYAYRFVNSQSGLAMDVDRAPARPTARA